jgi:flagellar biosynthesis/type III secretory pathway M-ring protein FliF/YscJ
MEYVLALLILLALAWFVTAPLRNRPGTGDEATEDPVLAELEARKEAKYREIRDAEMDRAQGKLSEEDFRRQDAELRTEAIAILKELDRVKGKQPERAKEGGG